jgi:hypothetical protein
MLSARSSRRSARYPFVTEVANAKFNTSSSCPNGHSVHRIRVPLRSQVCPGTDFYDQDDLFEQYSALSDEVSSLRTELAKYRQHYLHLKDAVFVKQRCCPNPDIDYAREAPALNKAIGHGKFSSAIRGLANQHQDGLDKMSQVRRQTTPSAVGRLEAQVLWGRAALKRILMDIGSMKDVEVQVLETIAATRRDFPRARFEVQLGRTKELHRRIRRLRETNNKLTEEVAALEIAVGGLPIGRTLACDEVEEMSDRLVESRDGYFRKCDEMIEIRNEQIQEVEAASFVIAEPTEQRRSGRQLGRGGREEVFGDAFSIESETDELPVAFQGED